MFLPENLKYTRSWDPENDSPYSNCFSYERPFRQRQPVLEIWELGGLGFGSETLKCSAPWQGEYTREESRFRL